MNWQFFIEVLVGGLLAGVMYSLVALGFVLIYKASGVFNFAQGAMVFFAALTFVSLVEQGVNFWVAIVVTLAVMVVLGIAIERLVLRPLVNQPQITLFMATIGLTFVLEGLAQLFWGAQPHGLELGIPDEPMKWLADDANINISQFDVFAAVVAGLLVAVLAVFFQTTRIGRALRAVADDHQAALAVGHSAAADLGDRVDRRRLRRAGRGPDVGCAQRRAVRADVHRAEGAAGADPGRLRVRRRARSSAASSSARRRSWPRSTSGRSSAAASSPGFPTCSRSPSCWCGPRGCSAKSGSSGYRPMLYREAGQFKTTYAADQQVFPIRQDRIAVAVVLVVAFVAVPLVANQYWLSAILTPFLILALATLGLNILTGYAGQLSLGTAAFMAVGAFMAYNFELRMPWMPILVSFALAGLCAAAVGIVFGLPSLRIKGFYLAVATLACQFFVLWALQRIGWFTNHSASGVITAQKVVILGYAFDTPARQVHADAVRRRGARGAGQEHAAQRDRAQVHGGARHGPRGRGDRHPHDADQAARVRDQLVLLRRRRRAVRVSRTSAPSSRRRSTSTCRSGSCSW